MTRDTSRRWRRRPAIVIETAEGRWPDWYTPLSRRDPERYAEQAEKIRKRLDRRKS